MERSDRARVIAKMLTIAAVVLGACVAAALAHVGIDLIGDFVLPRDAYDNVAHGSRAMTAALALAVLVACVACALCIAILDASGKRVCVRRALEVATNRSQLRFVGAVTAGASFVLLAMEAFDTLVQYGRVDDFSDLLGGSIFLALAIIVPTAIAVACALRHVLVTLVRSCRDLVAAVASFLRRAFQRVTVARFGADDRRGAGTAGRPCILSLNASRRAPPPKSERRFIAA